MNRSEINSAVEKLLESISLELLPDAEEKDNGMKTVSVQVFKLQIQKIAQKCHVENESALEFMAEREKAVIRKAYGNMQKISAVKTSSAERKNENLYLEFFQNIKKEFDKAAVLLLRELLKNSAQNYDQIQEEMRNMFQSIGEYLPGKGMKKTYGEYEKRKGALDKDAQDKAGKLEFGGGEILSFGEKTKDTVKNICKKWNQKRKILTMAPLLLLLCSFVVEAVITPVDVLFADLKSLLVFIIVLIVAFYVVYLKLLKLWCNAQIDKQCEDYLKTQLAQFRHNNTIMFQMEDAMQKAVEEYEEENLAALEQFFAAIERGSTGEETAEAGWFIHLKEQWERISA
ncbi:MAG: hypothetical protein NC314_08765 [Roseburia sp.]|nr:hypothetical protein [Ruminococcus sp.]MCM1155778.1 hypothetical protein [Roseburia sp.]MCM1242919.1 hypothetical protein [Roseburia sp.]